jgi:hypothetical protein
MSENRDRAQLRMDEHLKQVLLFMQRNIPTSKLIGVADAIPMTARLLWERHEQESLQAIEITEPSISCGTRPDATESYRDRACADGDFETAGCVT